MAIRVTSRALWQVIGHRMLDGSRETRDAEVFYGIGIWSRPTSDDKAEALVAFLGGGGGNPVIIATRNEDARKAVAAALNGGDGLAEGEAVLFGSSGLGFVHVKDDETVEVRKDGGTAVELALKSDLDEAISKLNALITAYKIHIHGGVTTGVGVSAVPTVVTAASSAAAVGTTVLKGQ
jgi:phage gp45-like